MVMIKLTRDNYYSQEANQSYWSASFVKSMMQCPERALAELRGEYTAPQSTALLIGSYIDAYFDSETEFERFCSQHPEIFHQKNGLLKSEYCRANDMIERAQRDTIFMEYCTGNAQEIKTGLIHGIPFKCKMDFYIPGKRIVDLKTAKDMEPIYAPERGKISFAEYWNWPLQMAIYQRIEGNMLPCYIAVITKQTPPDIAVIEIPQHVLNAEMDILEEKIPYFDAMRQGIIEPERCEKCSWCRQSRKLISPISLDEITEL